MDLCSACVLSLDPTRPDVVSFVGGGGKTTTLFRMAQEIVARQGRVVTTTTTRIFSAQVHDAPAHLAVGEGKVDWSILEQRLDRHGHCLLMSALDGDKAVGVAPTLVDRLVARSSDLGIAAVLIEADGSRRRPVKAPAGHEPVLTDSTNLLMPILGIEAVGAPIDAEHVHRLEEVQRLLAEPTAPPRRWGGWPDRLPRLTAAMAAYLLSHGDGGAKGRTDQMRFLPLVNKVEGAAALAAARLVAHQISAQGEAALIGRVGNPTEEPIRERWAPVAAVLLAGGGSRRFGSPKQLFPLAGVPLVVRAVELASQSGAAQVVVVTGAYAEQVEQALADAFSPWPAGLRLIHNPAWEAGQSTSLRAGLQALTGQVAAALFLPVDQPWLAPALLRRLVQAWRAGAALAVPAVDGTVRGAPALFDRRLWPELLALGGDVGGRALLAAHADSLWAVPAQPAWLRDVDDPADLL